MTRAGRVMLFAEFFDSKTTKRNKRDVSVMQDKIKVRVQKSKTLLVHNDLAQAATYFADTISQKLKAGTRDAIMLDGMACALMIAFAFEAKLNFMGDYLVNQGKLKEWNERQSVTKKRDKVFRALGISIDAEKRPLSSMERMKTLRDTLAHGKPALGETDEIMTGTHEEIDRGADLRAGWEKECTSDSVFEALADLDSIWKLMVEKSGVRVWETMTRGDRAITFIEHVKGN